MRIIGYGVMAVAVALGVAAALAATWFLFAGGILDLADGRTVSSGIARLDAWNREYADRWGRPRVGLLKVFILEPIALVIIALATRAAVGLGRRIVRGPERILPLEPETLAAQTELAQPGNDIAELEAPPADESAWAEPTAWDVPPLPALIARSSEPEDDPVLEPVQEPIALPDAPPYGVPELDRTIALRALADGATIDVTLRGLIDPVGPPAQEGGDRYVAVLLEVSNPGSQPFEDMPTGGALLVGSDGQVYRTAAQKQQPALREVRLGLRERCEGYLSFKLPGGVAPAEFRFTPNLGLATDTGEWQLYEPEIRVISSDDASVRSAEGLRSSTRLLPDDTGSGVPSS